MDHAASGCEDPVAVTHGLFPTAQLRPLVHVRSMTASGTSPFKFECRYVGAKRTFVVLSHSAKLARSVGTAGMKDEVDLVICH